MFLAFTSCAHASTPKLYIGIHCVNTFMIALCLIGKEKGHTQIVWACIISYNTIQTISTLAKVAWCLRLCVHRLVVPVCTLVFTVHVGSIRIPVCTMASILMVFAQTTD